MLAISLSLVINFPSSFNSISSSSCDKVTDLTDFQYSEGELFLLISSITVSGCATTILTDVVVGGGGDDGGVGEGGDGDA